MKDRIALFLAMLLVLAIGSALASDAMTVGSDIPFESITDFYYTYDASINPPFFQRYRFYMENGKYFFYHETRENGGWPQTEEDITVSGSIELTEEQWASFCSLIEDGSATEREESLDDGDAGPWLFIYWTGGEEEGRAYTFASYSLEREFEEFCIGLKEIQTMKISVSDGTNTIVYQLNDSPSARSLYEMLPLDVEVENYGRNEKIFYPERKIDTADGIEGGGEAGGLALFSPWGNVVMYYDSFGAYPGLYILGEATEGVDQIRNLSGTIHVEAVK